LRKRGKKLRQNGLKKTKALDGEREKKMKESIQRKNGACSWSKEKDNTRDRRSVGKWAENSLSKHLMVQYMEKKWDHNATIFEPRKGVPCRGKPDEGELVGPVRQEKKKKRFNRGDNLSTNAKKRQNTVSCPQDGS